LDVVRRLAGSFWIRALVSAALLAVVATQIDFGTLKSRISGGSWGWFAAAVVVLFASFVLAAIRWHIFLRAADIDVAPTMTLRAYLIGTFSNNFLPSQVGGDVTRTFLVGGRETRVRVAATVVIDRATAIGCLVLVAWLAVAFDAGSVPGALLAALGAATGALLVGGIVIAVLASGRTRLGGRLPRRAQAWGAEIAFALRACVRRHVVWRTVLLGAAFQGLVILSVWFLARAIDVHLSFAVVAATLPPVLLVASVPVSIAGYGVREASYVVLLRHVGVSATDATLLSLLMGITYAVASLPGGLALLRWSARPAQTEDREQEGSEEDLDARHESGRGNQGDLALAQRAGSLGEPLGHDDSAPDEAGDYERAADE